MQTVFSVCSLNSPGVNTIDKGFVSLLVPLAVVPFFSPHFGGRFFEPTVEGERGGGGGAFSTGASLSESQSFRKSRKPCSQNEVRLSQRRSNSFPAKSSAFRLIDCHDWYFLILETPHNWHIFIRLLPCHVKKKKEKIQHMPKRRTI